MHPSIEKPKSQGILSQPDVDLPSSPVEEVLQADPPPRAVEAVETEAEQPRGRRGFAAMDRTLVRELARKGGQAAHAACTAHELTSDEARHAARKGGQGTARECVD